MLGIFLPFLSCFSLFFPPVIDNQGKVFVFFASVSFLGMSLQCFRNVLARNGNVCLCLVQFSVCMLIFCGLLGCITCFFGDSKMRPKLYRSVQYIVLAANTVGLILVFSSQGDGLS